VTVGIETVIGIAIVAGAQIEAGVLLVSQVVVGRYESCVARNVEEWDGHHSCCFCVL
jgi:hypothetical protein